MHVHVDQPRHARMTAQIDDGVAGAPGGEPLFDSRDRRPIDDDRHVRQHTARAYVDEPAALQNRGSVRWRGTRADEQQSDEESHAVQSTRCKIAAQ
jgi:hypothetical protein